MQVSGAQSQQSCLFSIIEVVRVSASNNIVSGDACPLIETACNCQVVPETFCLKATKLGVDVLHRHRIVSSSLSAALAHRKCVRNQSEEPSN